VFISTSDKEFNRFKKRLRDFDVGLKVKGERKPKHFLVGIIALLELFVNRFLEN
jgi:hypothetical protein